MKKDMMNVDDIVKQLNKLAELDSKFVIDLIDTRVKCNEKVKNYVSCFGYFDEDNNLTKENKGVCKVGILGILNDILAKHQVGHDDLEKITDEEFNATNRILIDFDREKNIAKFYSTDEYNVKRKV